MIDGLTDLGGHLHQLLTPPASTVSHSAQKAITAMHDDSEECRLAAAEQLAGHNPNAAAQALSILACDGSVADEVRLAAAEQLAAVNPHAAAPACLAIARDEAVADEVRLAAAEQLAALNPSDAQAPRVV